MAQARARHLPSSVVGLKYSHFGAVMLVAGGDVCVCLSGTARPEWSLRITFEV